MATWAFEGLVRTPAGPQLTLHDAGNHSVRIAWPVSDGDWRRQATAALGAGGWTDVLPASNEVGDRRETVIPTSGGTRFFRLQKP